MLTSTLGINPVSIVKLKTCVKGSAICSAAIFKKYGSNPSGPEDFLVFNLIRASCTYCVAMGTQSKLIGTFSLDRVISLSPLLLCCMLKQQPGRYKMLV